LRPLQRRLSVEMLEDRVVPATFIWSGLGGNNNWSTGANWAGGVAPSSGASPDLVFNSVTPRMNTSNDIPGLVVNSISMSASNYTLGGSQILLGGNVTVGAGATNQRITLPVQLTTAASFTINNVADLTVAGQLSGSVTSTLTKLGVGTMTLSNNNSTYSAAIDIQAGRLVISHANALGTTTASTTVSANAQLQIRNIVAPIAESLIINGPGINNDGALLNSIGNSIWSGSIIMDSDASIGASAGTSLNVTGQISDTGFTGGRNLTKVGSGQLILSRMGGNTYRGQTVINNGILTIRDPLSLGAGSDATMPQNGTPQSGTIVNFNATTGVAGTLQLELPTTLGANDPNGILQNPAQPFHPVNNPYVGFQVFNNLLTLNGPGFGGIGALHNLTGNNIWNGGVTLGSPLPNTSDITIGVAADTELKISGVVRDDPGRTGSDIPDLRKILPGRLVFDNANTYRGNTFIQAGVLNIRDSRALGATGPGTGTPTVFNGAALELEVDSGLDGTPLRSHGRNLGFDSVNRTGPGQEVVVTGTSGTFTITLNGASTAALPFNATAAQVQAVLNTLPTIVGVGGNVTVTQNASVYRIVFGGTFENANVPLFTVTTTGATTAVVNNMYGLTITKESSIRGRGINNTGALRSISGFNTYTGIINLGSFLTPTGSIGVDQDTRAGHPTADNSYLTHDYSLTLTTADALRSSANTLFTKVGDGNLMLPVANLELRGPTRIDDGWITIGHQRSLGPRIVDQRLGETAQPNVVTVSPGAALHLSPAGADINLANRLNLFGMGISHPFAMLQQGALLSLGGNNTISGDIFLGSTFTSDTVGIGVDDPITTNPANASTLTTTGTIADFVPPPIVLTDLSASGFEEEERFLIDTGGFSGTISITYEFYAIPDQLRIYYPPQGDGGTIIFDTGLVSGGATINVPYGPGPSTFVEIVMNPGGQPPGTIWDIFNITITPDISPEGTGLTKMGSRLMRVQGDGTFTGDVEVQAGTLRVQNDSALGRKGSGTLLDPTTQSFTTTTTTVNAGALVQLAATIPQNTGGFAAGVQVWDERLVMNGAGQQVSVSGAAGTFTLSFDGQTTAALAFDATAAQMQAALNALSSIGGVGGNVTVTKAAHIYTVVFGGTLKGQNNPLMIATAGPAPGNVTVNVSGSNVPLSVLGEDNLWRGPMTLATDTILDIADHSRLIIYGPINDTPNPATSGSSLTLGLNGSGNTGELVLSGNNTYRGTTYVKQGILTVANNKALGGIGGPEVQTVTLGGAAAGTFTLTFDGQTTTSLPRNATAAQVQNALNNLSSIGGVGGSVTVLRAGNVLTITFGGGVFAGSNQPELIATGASGTTATVATTINGYGGTVVSMGAQLQMQGNLTIAGESLSLQGTGVGVGDVPDATPLRWFSVGPAPINSAQTAGDNASTGRVTGVSVDPSDPNVIYISTAGGGAWKTKNGGLTWTPLFETADAMFTGAITVAPNNPSVIYLGTGETNNSGDSFYGTGVYKSTDSGRTWSLLTNVVGGANPLLGTAVSRIVVDPDNENLIYVSTSNTAVNNNAAPGSGGVWRFNGSTWVNLTSIVSVVRGTQPGQAPFDGAPRNTPGPDDDYRISFPQQNASWSDLALVSQPGDPSRVLYAALGTFGGSYTDGVYRLINPQAVTGNNVRWLVGDPGNPPGPDTRSGTAFPTGPWLNGFPDLTQPPRNGVIKLAGVVTNPLLPTLFPGPNELNITVYASIVEPLSGATLEIQKSTNGGVSWAPTASDPPNYMGNQGDYDSTIIVHPTNPNIIYVGGCVDYLPPNFYQNQVLMSVDGGATWVDISIDANGNGPHTDGHAMALDSQGRLIYGNDGGVWRYELTADPNDAPTAGFWSNLNGGGMAITTFNGIASHPTNPDIILGGSQDNGTEIFTGSQAWLHVDDGDGGQVRFDPNNPNIAYHVLNGRLVQSLDGGFTWPNSLFTVGGLYFSFVVDQINSSRLVVAATFVEESLDQGQTWTRLNDTLFGRVYDVAVAGYQGSYQFDPDFPLVADLGASTYDPDTIYATDGFGLVVTKNHAQTWVNRTAGLPTGSGAFIENVMVDPRNRDTAYVVIQGNVSSGNNFIFKTTDAGQNWIDITGNLPDVPFWRVVIDPRDGTLYLGTDQGIWALNNGTGSWQRFGAGMPNVQVKEIDLNMNLNTITAGTYGRSAFQFYLDDVQANSGALRVTSGTSAWTGPVRMAQDTTITVGGSQPLSTGAPAALLDIIGVVSDQSAGGNFALTKDGVGTLVLSGSNTYGGVTHVQNGVLTVNNPDALGTFNTSGGDIVSQGGTIVHAGASLHLQTDLEGEPIQLNGNGVPAGFNGHNSGALRNVSGDNTYTGPLTLNTNATIGVDSGSQLTIGAAPSLSGTGTISGASSLTKELTGTLVLASDNVDFTGGTSVFQGAVRLEHAGALGTGSAGARVLDGAQMQLRTPTSGPNAGQPISVSTPLVLSGTGIFGTGALLNVSGNNAWNGPITFDVLPGFSPNTFPFGTVSFNVVNAADTLTIGGAIAETSRTGLTKIGPGELVLRQANAYSGATEVVQGTLDIREPGALGLRSGTASVQRIVTLSATQSGTFTLAFGGQSTVLNWGATVGEVRDALEALSSIGLGNIATVSRTNVETTTQSGPGAPNTGYLYTVVFGGTLANTTTPLTASGALGTGASASVVATGGIDTRVANGATLELDSTGSTSPAGFTVAGRRLTLNGGTGVNGGGALRNAAGNNTWNGPIQMLTNTSVGAAATTALTLSGGVAAAGLDLTKVGAGTVIFPNGTPPNTQLRTVINSGTVQVDGLINDVRLAGGTISGTGNVASITSNNPATGSRVSPGVSFPTDQIGTLNSTGTVLNATNTFFVNLSNPGTPTGDLLNLTGNINLGNATLGGIVAANVVVGNQFTIIQTTGAVIGQFAGTSTTPVAGGTTATIAYIDNQKFVVDYFSDRVVVTRQVASVTMSLAASETSPVYGRPGTFIATLTPESPALSVSGNVVFTVVDPNNNTFQFFVLIDPTTNTATFDPSTNIPNGFQGPLELGTYLISADYNGVNQSGSQAFNPASAGPISVTVTAAASTTTLGSSHPVSTMYGVTVTFTATVTSAVVSPVQNTLPPEGTVSFFNGGNFLGTITLVPGSGVSSTATFSTSSLTVGTHNLTAVYNSDGFPDNYLGSSSSVFNQLVTRASTTTTVLSSLNPSNYGDPVTFTATVVPPAAGTPTGTVNFMLGSTLLGTGTLSGGVASYTTTSFQLPAGANQTVTAIYSGDSNFTTSSGTVLQSVIGSASTTSVVTSVNPSVYGQAVTFTATVSSAIPGGNDPTGTVTFLVGSTIIGTGTLNTIGGVTRASYTATAGQLPLGTSTITAEYAGDVNYDPSSGTVSQTVIESGTTTTLTAAPARATATRGVVFRATVVAVSPGSGIPSGVVTFTDVTTGRVLGTASVDSSGVAALQAHLGNPQGVHRIRADYAGDGSYLPSSSGLASVTIIANGTRTSAVVLRSSSNPSIIGDPVTFVATVRDTGGTPRVTPNGTVAFYSGTTLLGYGTLQRTADGVARATFTTDQLSLGSHPILAHYSGNPTFRRVNSPVLTQLVKEIPTRTSDTSLVSSLSTTVYGQPVLFTATVTDTGGSPLLTPTGVVRFLSDGVEIGTGVLSQVSLGVSRATLTTTVLSVGVHNVTAEYVGDTDFAGGVESSPVVQTVTPVSSTTTVTSSANPSRYGQLVTLRALVSPLSPSQGVATGTVTFRNTTTGAVLGTVPLNANGVGVLTTSTLGVGSHAIAAEYSGDGNVLPSAGSLTQVVQKSATQATIVRSTANSNTLLTLRSRITAVSPGSGIPTGSVSFFVNGVLRGVGVVNANGVAALTLPNGLPVGTHTIRVVYSGDPNFMPTNRTTSFNFVIGRST
jgi:large repetitive protein